PSDHATRLSYAGAGGGVESLLQPGSRDGWRSAHAAADDDNAGSGSLALLCARALSGSAIQLVGVALGDRAVQARRSSLPRSGKAGNWTLVTAPVPREGSVT